MGKKIQAITFFLFAVVFLVSGTVGILAAPAGGQDQIKSLFLLGQKAFEEKEYQKSIDYFEQVIEIQNDFAPAYYILGLIYQEVYTDDPLYPLWYFETAINVNSDYAPAYDALCRSYYELQRFTEAENICKKGLEIDPNLTPSQLAMGWIYLSRKSDPDRAIYYFEKVSAKMPIPAVHFGLGLAYIMKGDHGKAVGMVTQLRLQGQEDFASNLESILRGKTPAEKFIPSGYIDKMAAQNEAIKRQQAQAEAAVNQAAAGGAGPVLAPVVMAPQITGTAQVRLKGKIKPPQIQGLQGYSEPATYGGQDGAHPGGLSSD